MILFDNDILAFEKSADWKSATEYAYRNWKTNPLDLNALLCAGTELWYALLIIDYYDFAPSKPVGYCPPETDRVQDLLCDVARWGFEHFSENALFNAYFGYMIKVMPYFFLDYQGDYDGWREKGIAMMRRAYELDSTNPFIKVMYYNAVYNLSEEYVAACREFWRTVDPNMPRDGEVNQYFIRILWGDVDGSNGSQ